MLAHGILYFLARAASGAIGIAMLAAFARLLTPQQFGIYALSAATATMASTIAFQWLCVAFARFYPAHRDSPKHLLATVSKAFWLATVAVVAVFAAALPFRSSLRMEFSLLVVILGLAIAQGRYNLALQAASARSAPIAYGLISLTRTSLALAVGCMLLFAGMGEYGALLGLFAGFTVGAMPVRFLQSRPGDDPGVSKTTMTELLRYGLPLTLTFLATMLLDFADRFLISWLLEVRDVAPYAAAYDLVQQSLGMLLGVLFLAAFPRVVRAFDVEGEVVAHRILSSLGTLYLAIGVPATIGLALLAPDIAKVIFGNALSQTAEQLIPWLAIALLIGSYKSYYLDLPFQIRRVTKYQGYVVVFMALLNVVLNIILLPQFGTLGAAWATLAAFLAGAILSWRIGRRLLHLSIFTRDTVRIGLATLTMAIALLLMPDSAIFGWLVAKVLAGCAVYVAAAAALNVSGSRSVVVDIALRVTKFRRRAH